MVWGCTIFRASISSSCWWSVISHRPTEWRIFPLEKLLSPLKQKVCLRREAFRKDLEFWEDYNTACLPCWCHVGTVPIFWGLPVLWHHCGQLQSVSNHLAAGIVTQCWWAWPLQSGSTKCSTVCLLGCLRKLVQSWRHSLLCCAL